MCGGKGTVPLLESIAGPADVRRLPKEQLQPLADEVRRRLIDVVSQTGGHIGAGLGVVELTVALCHCFDSPRDKIVWDVGHQAYPWKILTGRHHCVPTLRQPGGLSGFLRRSESEHDQFGAGHAGTGLSAAFGIAAARDLKGEHFKVVAVVGDGALTCGLPYEAMNNAGHSGRDIIMVLNDNGMSIAPNVGAINKYLGSIIASPMTVRVRERVKGLIESVSHIVGGQKLVDFGEAITQLAGEYPSLVAITAAMPSGTGTNIFQKKWPERFFDVGIAEAHATTFAAGLATQGVRPIVAIYSTFLQRAYDSIIHDVAIQQLPVIFCLDRAGMVGEDGQTHMGLYDIAYMLAVPHLTVTAPKDGAELIGLLRCALEHGGGPFSLRYPRDKAPGDAPPAAAAAAVPYASWEVLRRGRDCALLAVGVMG